MAHNLLLLTGMLANHNEEGGEMKRNQIEKLRRRDMLRGMTAGEFARYARDNGDDAVIPVCGLTMDEIRAKLAVAEAMI